MGDIWHQNCENRTFPYYKYDIIVNIIIYDIQKDCYLSVLWNSNVEAVTKWTTPTVKIAKLHVCVLDYAVYAMKRKQKPLM